MQASRDMTHRFLLAAVTSIGVVAAGGSVRTDEKLSLQVTPNVSNAPCNLIVQTVVARHAENRWLIVEADSGDFYRSSAIQLDGANAPLTTEFRFNNLPSGNYTVMATLRNEMGEETTAQRTLIVLSRFGEP
jgi:hypothetical protein